MVEFTIICQGSECDDTDCPSCSTFCDGCTLLEPTCPGLSQKRGNRWREWHVDENYGVCENEACCASDEEDCCETNVGAIVGLVIALVVVIGGSIYAYRKYKGGKIKGPDEEARHGDSSEPDVARTAEPETEPETEEMGLMGKLAWLLFRADEPAVGSEGVAVEAEAMGEQGELAPEGVVVEAEAMWEQGELEPEV